MLCFEFLIGKGNLQIQHCTQSNARSSRMETAASHRNIDPRSDARVEAKNYWENRLGKQVSFCKFYFKFQK